MLGPNNWATTENKNDYDGQFCEYGLSDKISPTTSITKAILWGPQLQNTVFLQNKTL